MTALALNSNYSSAVFRLVIFYVPFACIIEKRPKPAVNTRKLIKIDFFAACAKAYIVPFIFYIALIGLICVYSVSVE
jgi:hypothetical protein